MRRTILALTVLAAVAAPAPAQGGAPADPAAQMRKRGFAGPGHVQASFLAALKKKLVECFGEERAKQMLDSLKRCGLSAAETTRLMNGGMTKSRLQDCFSASRAEMDGVQECVKAAVAHKDRCLLFGMILAIMVTEFDVDPSSDFCKQIAAAKDEMAQDDFRKLCKGSVSTKTVAEAFGLEHKDDAKFMQDVMNQVHASPYPTHPLAASLEMSRGRTCDPEEFPEVEEGMRGHGGAYADGTAGGLPFDTEAPATPYFDG